MEAVRQLSASISPWLLRAAALPDRSDSNSARIFPSSSSSSADGQLFPGARTSSTSSRAAAVVRCAASKREKSSTRARPSSSSSLPGGGFGAKTAPKPFACSRIRRPRARFENS